MITRKNIFKLALGTLVGFGLLGWMLAHFMLNISLKGLFFSNSSLLSQLVIGLIYGMLAAFIGWFVVKSRFLQSTLTFFVNLIQPLKLTIVEIVFISFCAGVGEELFFRGTIQPILGIWLTAILFVALHGYLNPFNLRITVYGIFMTVIIAGMGYLTIRLGLVTAMMAHMVVDILLLYKLSHYSLAKEDAVFSQDTSI